MGGVGVARTEKCTNGVEICSFFNEKKLCTIITIKYT